MRHQEFSNSAARVGGQAGRQANRQAGMQASKQAGRLADRQAYSMQTGNKQANRIFHADRQQASKQDIPCRQANRQASRQATGKQTSKPGVGYSMQLRPTDPRSGSADSFVFCCSLFVFVFYVFFCVFVVLLFVCPCFFCLSLF